MRPIEDYGNKLSIVGMIVGNGEENDIILFNSESNPNPENENVHIITPTTEELQAIFKQLDTLEITNSQKTVLRKSQRQIDQVVAWNVFRRDGYRCVYCGKGDMPLTFDHIILWEEGGASVEENGLTACKKCNHTRGSKQLPDFLESSYYKSIRGNIDAMTYFELLKAYSIAFLLPLAKPRSR